MNFFCNSHPKINHNNRKSLEKPRLDIYIYIDSFVLLDEGLGKAIRYLYLVLNAGSEKEELEVYISLDPLLGYRRGHGMGGWVRLTVWNWDGMREMHACELVFTCMCMRVARSCVYGTYPLKWNQCNPSNRVRSI